MSIAQLRAGSRVAQLCLRAAVFLAAIFGFSAAASAFILQISATGFAPRCPCDNPASNTDIGEEHLGRLLNAEGQYFAPVVFPAPGRVCKFALIYRDNDAAGVNVTAKLMRKRFAAGDDAFNPPVVMAKAKSAGADNFIRIAEDTTIKQGAIHPGNSFYFVELDVPFSTLEVLGVQIDFRKTCPQV